MRWSKMSKSSNITFHFIKTDDIDVESDIQFIHPKQHNILYNIVRRWVVSILLLFSPKWTNDFRINYITGAFLFSISGISRIILCYNYFSIINPEALRASCIRLSWSEWKCQKVRFILKVWQIYGHYRMCVIYVFPILAKSWTDIKMHINRS